MNGVPFAVPLAWSYPRANDLQADGSAAEIGSDSKRHREVIR